MSFTEGINVAELVERLGSDEDAVRKMAVFKLQSNIGDPSFADVFASEGGITKLRYLTLNATGNTLAYSLASFSRLLEVDKGWEYVNQELVKRVVELVVTHPLVNILRGAMSILVAIVSHPHTSTSKTTQPNAFGFRALKPAIAEHPQFLEMLVSRLSAADHTLCTTALQLINSLMRDAITSGSDFEWPKFIKRLQDLGVIRAVYGLMQSTALQDLAHPLLEFQALTKFLLRKWREVPVDLDVPEHRRAIKSIHLASNPEKSTEPIEDGDDSSKPKHNPTKWRRLGFQTENPTGEFEEVGFLGMMDLTDYVRKDEDGFQKLLLEQSAQPPEQRCPIARASLTVTSIIYDHFEIDKADLEDPKGYLTLDSRSSIDRAFRPMILQWARLHTSGLQAFLRLWKATGAEMEDFSKVAELVRILLEAVVGAATRSKEIHEIEDELANYDYQRLRELQMELLELTYEDTWGQHLKQVRDELSHEALQFMKEQRVRCLLAGAWFPTGSSSKDGSKKDNPTSQWRFVRLSHNRRWLHYADFLEPGNDEPGLEDLPEKIDLTTVSSVISNVTATTTATPTPRTPTHTPTPSTTSTSTLTPASPPQTRITINALHASTRKEAPLLTLHPPTPTLASEWLDGLLMLLNQQPITAETTKLLRLVAGYGLKIRLLNVRLGEGKGDVPEVPGREGTEGGFWYEIFGGE